MVTLFRVILSLYLGIGLLLGLVAGFSRLFVHVAHGLGPGEFVPALGDATLWGLMRLGFWPWQFWTQVVAGERTLLGWLLA
ncbi:MAG: hypothetical protein OXF26_01775 [Alphaproteobacteria bacterium]|nr:hypothetical protein [Alphaproteobacteria bacterium]MCY4320299.1 hypothetical protein [Alphaproteobacteria bacterium]